MVDTYADDDELLASSAVAHQLTDDRLAWLVARDELRKKAAGGLLRRIAFGAARGAGSEDNVLAPHAGNEVQAELISDKMMRYSIVVDEAAQRFTEEERVRLRT